MHRHFICLGAVGLVLCTGRVGEATPIKPLTVYAVEYQPYISNARDNSGLFNQFLTAGQSYIENPLRLRTFPLKRAISFFMDDQDGILLESADVIPQEYLDSLLVFNMMRLTNHLVFRKDFELAKKDFSKTDLKGLKAAVLRGAEDELSFVKQAKSSYIESNSLAHSLQLLLKGRVQYFICLALSCAQTVRTLPGSSEKVFVHRKEMYSITADMIVHKKNLYTSKVIKTMLLQLYQSGKFAEIVKSFHAGVEIEFHFDEYLGKLGDD